MRHAAILEREGAVLVIVDIQEKLAGTMEHRRQVVENAGKLVQVWQVLDLPIIATEQYPKGMGRLVAPLQELLDDCEPIEKLAFSCIAHEGFATQLAAIGTKTLVLAGMEAHICILQTALHALARGYAVHVPIDGICSRHSIDWQTATRKMQQNGVTITTTETIVFELLEKAGTAEFKQVLPLVK